MVRFESSHCNAGLPVLQDLPVRVEATRRAVQALIPALHRALQAPPGGTPRIRALTTSLRPSDLLPSAGSSHPTTAPNEPQAVPLTQASALEMLALMGTRSPACRSAVGDRWNVPGRGDGSCVPGVGLIESHKARRNQIGLRGTLVCTKCIPSA